LGLLTRPNKPGLHPTWEAINAIVYELGGILYILGSILFLPAYEEHVSVASLLFVVASVLYIIVSLHDCIEIFFCSEEFVLLDAAAAVSYVVGAVIFIFGSIFFLPGVGRYTAGAWCFIWGSFLFVAASAMNAMQIFQAKSLWTARYLNLTAVCYVIGSTMFMVASVPYLFTFESSEDQVMIDKFLAVQYIVGSVFFAIGGIINYIRAYLAVQDDDKTLALLWVEETTGDIASPIKIALPAEYM
jgi:hypothetical protein